MKRIPSIKELNEQIHKTKNQQINYIFNIRVFDFDFRSLLRLESNVDRMEFSNFKEEIRKRIQYRRNELQGLRQRENNKELLLQEGKEKEAHKIPTYEEIMVAVGKQLKKYKKMEENKPKSSYQIALKRCKECLASSILFLRDLVCCRCPQKQEKKQLSEDESAKLTLSHRD